MVRKHDSVTPPARIRSDDSSNWVDEITGDGADPDEGTGDSDGSNTSNASDNSDDWVGQITRDDRDSPLNTQDSSDEESTQLTVAVSHYECDNCGMVTSRSRHGQCGAPIVYVGDEWQCGGCGTGVAARGNCFDCGASIEYEPTSVPVDLSPTASIERIEELVHEETNQRRSDHSVGTLGYSQHLSAIALQHSRDMADRDFFDHTSPDGDNAGDRYRTFGHDDRSSGENIACIPLDPTTSARGAAQEVVKSWMKSPGHRKNILRDRFTEEGIGIYFTPNGSMYATQNFC